MQQQEPDDYVLATGITTSVRDFTTRPLLLGELKSVGKEPEKQKSEKMPKLGLCVCRSIRSTIVPLRLTCCWEMQTKAREKLGWQPICDLQQLVQEMVEEDLRTP